MNRRRMLAAASVGAAGTLTVPIIIMALLIGLVVVVVAPSGGGAGAASANCDVPGIGATGSGSFAYPMEPGSYRLSSGFGPRGGGFHSGVDLAAPIGTNIYAAGAGEVVAAGPASGFGYWIVINHDVDGQLVSTVYGHMYADGVLVKIGQRVRTGDLIAKVGNNGQSTGPHLHFEVWTDGRASGTAVDPLPWLDAAATADTATDPDPVSDNTPDPGGDLLPNPPAPPQNALPAGGEVSANVTTIVGVVKGAGLSLRAAVIAVATAAQESGIRSIDYGDRDSLGLYQQRPSQGWGTREQILDPVLATLAFLGVATHAGNPGLVDVAGWETMPLTDAAQAVQRSGFPAAYAKWEQAAAELVEAARDAAPITGGDGSGTTGAPSECGVTTPSGSSDGPVIPPDLVVRTDWPAESASIDDPTSTGNITPRLAALLDAMNAAGYTTGGVSCWDPHPQNPASDHPRGRACDVFFGHPDPAEIGRGWGLANWLIANQATYAVTNVIWQGQSWGVWAPQSWGPYTSSVYGCPSPANVTGCHYDHVHVSVA